MKGHIKARGEKCWAIVIDVGRDSAGKRKQKWHSFKGTKRQAEAERTRLLNDLRTGAYVQPHKESVADYLPRWLEVHAKPQVSAKTLERYDEIVRKHLIPALGHHHLTDLKPLHIQEYYSSALLTGRLSKKRQDQPSGLSARTVLHHHRILRQALEQAVKWQILVKNPANAVVTPKPKRTEMIALDEKQTALLLKSCEQSRLYIIVLLAVTTGLRRGEVLALRWRDVDFETSTLRVMQSLEETKSTLDFKEPKTSKSKRSVELLKTTIDALRKHRAEQNKIRLMLGPAYTSKDLVCAKVDGNFFSPKEVTRAFWALVRGIKELPNFRLHDLRHSHATQLLRAGVHPKIVSERLGHSTIGITLDIYSHLLPGMQKEAAGKLDAVLQAALNGAAAV
jgi:integrase